MKGKKHKTSKRWKFIVILDDNKNNIKTFELNDDQKLMIPMTRNKKRKLNYEFKTSTALDNESNENSENETNSTTHFSFHEEIIFSYRNDSQNFLSIEPNTNINLSILEDGYFGKSYSENIDTDFQENILLDRNENIEDMLL